MKSARRPAGIPAFIFIWIGQIISMIASSMSNFGLTIWMYQQTHSATAMGLLQVFFITPFLVMSPIAGVMVDRYNRKLMMMISDLAAVLATFGIFVLYANGHLQFWHLYFAAAINGLGNAFQWPAFSATISTIVPKHQLGRINGFTSLLETGPGLVAPAMAGALMPVVGLTGLLFIDFATFFIAIGALLFVIIPSTPRTAEGRLADQESMLKQAAFGFRYIFARPSLLGLQMVFFFGNLFSGMAFAVNAPMILSRSGQNSLIFGTVSSMFAAGSIIGGIVMSTWGGFKRRVHGVLLGWTITSLGMIFYGLGQNLYFWIPAAILTSIASPMINGSNQAIWQTKVPADLQGRVFSARVLIAWMTNPISPIMAGTLADYMLEPVMRSQGEFSRLFSHLVGSGPGAGMSLLIVFCGVLGVIIGLGGYFFPFIRNAEELLPDSEEPLVSSMTAQ